MIPADGRRVRAAVLGSPIGHSLSPAMHAAAYAALGLTWWRYEAIECDAAGLPAFLDQCGPDWAGLSLTMPLKRAVVPLLDRLDPLVADIGAANTVVLAAAQRLGYNTDAPGMVRALAAHGVGPGRGQPPAGQPLAGQPLAGQPPAGRVGPALVIGAGATACAALAALRELGERSVTVLVRDRGRAEELRRIADGLAMSVTVAEDGRGALAGCRLVVSTVPAGAADFAVSIIGRMTPAPHCVFDVVYRPWPTPLAKAAAAVGAVVVGGFDLLLHQAALQVELMTGRPAPIDQMRRAGLARLTGAAGVG